MWYSSLKFCIIFFIFNLTAKNEKSGTRHLQWRSSNEGIIIFFQNIRSLYFRCLKFFFMFTEIFTRTARTKNFDFWAQRLLGLEKTLKHNMCWKHIYLFIYQKITKILRTDEIFETPNVQSSTYHMVLFVKGHILSIFCFGWLFIPSLINEWPLLRGSKKRRLHLKAPICYYVAKIGLYFSSKFYQIYRFHNGSNHVCTYLLRNYLSTIPQLIASENSRDSRDNSLKKQK